MMFCLLILFRFICLLKRANLLSVMCNMIVIFDYSSPHGRTTFLSGYVMMIVQSVGWGEIGYTYINVFKLIS